LTTNLVAHIFSTIRTFPGGPEVATTFY
jgi:hypothetical protein